MKSVLFSMKGVFRGALTTAMGEVLGGQRWERVALGAWLENVDVATWNMLLARTPRGGNTARFAKKNDAFFTFDLFVILFWGRRSRGRFPTCGQCFLVQKPIEKQFQDLFRDSVNFELKGVALIHGCCFFFSM